MSVRRIHVALVFAVSLALTAAAAGDARAERGYAPTKDSLREEPPPRPSGELWIYAENLREEVKVNIYDERGDFDDAALAKLDNVMRGRRSGQVRAVDPRLYEIMSAIYDHFGKKRMTLVSGFRYKERNSSRHFHAAAADFRIPGVPAHKLFEYAKSLDCGGHGIGRYPRSNFVHVDIRAPGEPSYYWVDRSPPGRKARKKRPKRKKKTGPRPVRRGPKS